MLCKDLMKPHVTCIGVNDNVQVAAKHMRDHNIGFLPVCDVAGKVVGTLTDRDLVLRVIAENKQINLPVNQVMTREVISCRADDDLRTAEALMGKHHVSRIIVVGVDGKPVGVISLSDIAIREDAGRVAQTIRQVSEREVHTH